MVWKISNWRLPLNPWWPLGEEADRSPQGSDVEPARRAMLALLHQCKRECSSLEHRIACAHTIETLWYLRGDLLTAIAVERGENIAFDLLEDASRQFPNALKLNPQRLVGAARR